MVQMPSQKDNVHSRQEATRPDADASPSQARVQVAIGPISPATAENAI